MFTKRVIVPRTAGHFLIPCLALLLSIPLVSAGEDRGRARYTPWSGPWWPIVRGGVIQPLIVYDRLTGRRAAAWESRYRPPSAAEPWWGYCHAWSAASVLDRVPRITRWMRAANGTVVPVTVGAQKGMLTACHDADPAHVYGQRYSGRPGDNYHDMNPVYLWKCLRMYVRQRGVPLILDISAGREVWNYPVFAYHVEYRLLSDGRQLARMKILMADVAVGPTFIGTRVKAKTYLFTFRTSGRSIVMASAQWVGASRRDHPDFAWYPTGVRPRNPELSYASVRRIIASTQSRDPSDRSPPSPEEAVQPLTELADADEGRAIPIGALELATILASDNRRPFPIQATATPLRGDTPQAKALYTVRVESERDGFLTLFHLGEDGDVRLVFPRDNAAHRVTAGQPLTIGGPGSATRLSYPAEAGPFRLKALFTQQPLLLGRLEGPDDGNPVGVRLGWESNERELVRQILTDRRARRM